MVLSKRSISLPTQQRYHGSLGWLRRIPRRPVVLFTSVALMSWFFVFAWTIQRVSVAHLEQSGANLLNRRTSPSSALHRHSRPSFGTSSKQGEDEFPKKSTQQTTTYRLDATFNGIPLVYQNGHQQIRSSYYCTGRSMGRRSLDGGSEIDDDSWMFRSCRFRNLCFDTNKQDYVMFVPPSKFSHLTETKSEQALALGGINPRWDLRTGEEDKGSWKVKWFPQILSDSISEGGFYQLPSKFIWLPFHSLAAHNVGHLVWDDFYPIFSLLRLFDLQHHDSLHLLPIRQVLKHKLYATCDIRKNKRQQCASNFEKFWPLMGVTPEHFSTTKTFRFDPTKEGEDLKSPLVCASTAVAGLGMLTDHGYRDHGWNENFTFQGYNIPPHNLGRGPNFAAFSNFMAWNLLGADRRQPSAVSSIRVTFSILSSRKKDRQLDFSSEIEYLQQVLPPELFQVEARALWNMTLNEQFELAQSSNIFITACGGGSMSATFMHPGSSLILYYNPTGGVDFSTFQSIQNQPARLDWDLLNQAGHLRVHWWPIQRQVSREEQQADSELLHQLILQESQLLLNGM